MSRKKRKASRLARYIPRLLWSVPLSRNGWGRPMIYCFGDYELDEHLSQLRRAGVSVAIEPKVFDVLTYLLQHRDRVVSKDELLDKLWPGQVVGESALTRCIRAARVAVGDDGTKQEIIETQHGRGYRFVAAVAAPVTSAESRVLRQEEAVRSQPAGVSSQEPSTNGQPIGSVISVPVGSQDLPSKAPESSPGMPADVGMTLPSTEAQPVPPLPPPPQVLDASALAVRRSWSARYRVVLGLILLVGGSLTVSYLSHPTLSLQDAALRTDAASAALPLPDKPSILVLPFVNLSGDPEQEYFSDGMTEEITATLSRLSSLFVIARTSAFFYKGKQVKVQDISKEMGVRYVLEGSVHKADGQLRINAQLIDATTGEHLWSERFDRPFKDIFTLQDEIVRKIVTTLELQLTLEEQGWIVRKRTDNLDAYDSVLRGMESLSRLTNESNAQARQMFEKAVALDPQYAEAYVWLGSTYYIEWMWRWSADPAKTLEQALALAQQALALDDSLPAAHGFLSNVYARKQQYDQALTEGERAIALDPNNADSYAWRAQVLNVAGRPEEALQAIKKAMRFSPRSPNYLLQLGWAYLLTGQSAEAIAALKETVSRSPNNLGAHVLLASAYVAQWISQKKPDSQMLTLALATTQGVLALSDAYPLGHAMLGHVYLQQKQYDQAMAEMRRAIVLDPKEAMGSAFLAETLSRVGKPEEAMKMIEQVLQSESRTVDGHLVNVGIAYYFAGKPEEAITFLKQYLTRYPGQVGAHLTLAAVYSELGKEPEAQAEAAEVLRINPKFSLEVHKERVPIKDPMTLERHIEALRKAGLK